MGRRAGGGQSPGRFIRVSGLALDSLGSFWLNQLLLVALLGGHPWETTGGPLRTSGGGAAPNIKASITTRAADVHGRC